MSDESFFDDVEMPSDEELVGLAEMVSKQVLLEDELCDLEELFKRKKAELADVAEVLIPEKMALLNLRTVQLSSGETVTITNSIYASLSAKNKPEGFKWLRDNGHGEIIKEQVVNEMVHGATLKAFVREQLSQGSAIPLKLFGVHEVTRAVIK